MNADLEEQLKEMGPEYGAVVGRLRAAKTIEPCRTGQRSESGGHATEWLIAASLLIAAALAITFRPSRTSQPLQVSQTSCPREYRLSPAEMIATQRPDGSWQNDFLTHRNAEVLASCDTPGAHIAYKKAMRNLRSKGMLSDIPKPRVRR